VSRPFFYSHVEIKYKSYTLPKAEPELFSCILVSATLLSEAHTFFRTYVENKVLNYPKAISFFVPAKARKSSTIIQKKYTKVISFRHSGRMN